MRKRYKGACIPMLKLILSNKSIQFSLSELPKKIICYSKP